MMPTGTWSRGAGRITIAWVSQAFAQFLDGRAWTHAEGPVTLFEQATGRRRGNIRRLRGAAAAIFGLSLPSPGSSSWSPPPLPSSPLLGGMLSGRNGSRALSIAPMTSS
jgi:hypothetical protein